MTDILSPAERSKRMSRIRSKDTRPELVLRKILHGLGLRYRLHSIRLPGKPDLIFPRYNVVVFVHGCFWHRHAECNIATTPKSNTPFWLEKFEKNVERDIRVRSQLENLGWRVFVVWECELASTKKAQATAERLNGWIRDDEKS
ncbi:very short patch repair endonuclease [Pseudomonas vanderleydeniana]|uniref:Very short patch repair endonuclease n=1 Tax=Pseudomonas vanderleydeniana TaxID=2745495 RepID=A0A9E6PH45_9PSED|nr:DNA mismatch endonuclease Vsr [Pseudomonas vanderleydeniana]QXI26419.1 DNA mismatch endonuclease Vsr [Pseudomonas vanderleydeniana]